MRCPINFILNYSTTLTLLPVRDYRVFLQNPELNSILDGHSVPEKLERQTSMNNASYPRMQRLTSALYKVSSALTSQYRNDGPHIAYTIRIDMHIIAIVWHIQPISSFSNVYLKIIEYVFAVGFFANCIYQENRDLRGSSQYNEWNKPDVLLSYSISGHLTGSALLCIIHCPFDCHISADLLLSYINGCQFSQNSFSYVY